MADPFDLTQSPLGLFTLLNGTNEAIDWRVV